MTYSVLRGISSWQLSENVVIGLCPFCGHSSGFKLQTKPSNGLVTIKCDTCAAYVLFDLKNNAAIPAAKPNALRNLPKEINKYYQEALDCIAARSPNGAATLFRKLIHQVGIHYQVAKIPDDKPIMAIVEAMESEGHINKKLVDALRQVKDLGNDGAHVNANEPTMEQIFVIKDLVDSFLQATVLQDISITKAEQARNEQNKTD